MGADPGRVLDRPVDWADVHAVVGEGVDAVALRRNVFSIRHRARSQHSSKAPVTLASRMRAAYHAESALAAEAQLQALAKELERIHPGAAGQCAKAWPRR